MNTIPIEKIVVASGRRPLRDITELAQSIKEVGLLNPITTTHEYRLVAGYHRLEACKLLGWAEIPANVVTLDATDAELAEIDENLVRHELSVLERGEYLTRRKQLYELKYPETRKGVAGGKARQGTATEIISFAEDAAVKMDVTPRTIRQEVQIAESIPLDVRDLIRDTWLAESKTELIRFSQLEISQQRYIAGRIRGNENLTFFCESILILERIRDAELYRSEYATFDDFYNEEWAKKAPGPFDEFLEIAREVADIFIEEPISHTMKNPRTRHLRELRFFWAARMAA